MAYMRRDVWSLGDPWAPELDWYEKAVKALLALPIENPVSWRSLAAMHGIDAAGWQVHGYIAQGQVLPALDETLWNQCQHQSWYFLPWHRGYLHRFEAIVRATIVQLGGPADWALPYWNYNGHRPESSHLPVAFRTAQRPDGGKNHLFVEARFGADGSGNVILDTRRLALDALREDAFDDDVLGGFGGPATLFSWAGQTNGLLESRPHNLVHSVVGGATVAQPTQWSQVGLMSTPQTAALDPIFWLHHANIDRLWEVWRKRDPRNLNPGNPDWLEGPAPTGRAFLLPEVDGRIVSVKVADIASAEALGYEYDDVSDPLPGFARVPGDGGLMAGGVFGWTMPSSAREFASSIEAARMQSDAGSVRVRIDARSRPGPGLQIAGMLDAPSPRVYLRLDGIRSGPPGSISDATVMDVYVAAPSHPESEQYVGSVSMFGASLSEVPNGPHSGAGLSQTFEITDSFDLLSRSGALASDEIMVNFKKASDRSDLSSVKVGKVRLLHKP